MDGRTEGRMVSGWFLPQEKEAGAPPCGCLVNCFIQKSRAPGWWGCWPSGHRQPRSRESQAAGLPPPQLPAAPGKQPGPGKSSTISLNALSRNKTEDGRFSGRGGWPYGTGALGRPTTRGPHVPGWVASAHVCCILHSVAVLSQGQKGARRDTADAVCWDPSLDPCCPPGTFTALISLASPEPACTCLGCRHRG